MWLVTARLVSNNDNNNKENSNKAHKLLLGGFTGFAYVEFPNKEIATEFVEMYPSGVMRGSDHFEFDYSDDYYASGRV